MRSRHKQATASRWRASDTLMQMIDEELKSGHGDCSSSFSLRVLEAIADAKRDRPAHVGVRPIKVVRGTGKGR